VTRNEWFSCLGAVVATVAVGAWAVQDLRRARRAGYESAAIGDLKSLVTAQTLFLEGDKDGDGVRDYGDLAELKSVGLINPRVGEGVLMGEATIGYTIRLVTRPPDATTGAAPRWLAVANPVAPGVTGDRSFCATQDGMVVHTADRPLEPTADCSLPTGVVPLGR
jgi:hypothetical protein